MGQRSTHRATGFWFLLCTGLAGIVALEFSMPLAPQVTAAPPAVPLSEVAPEPDPFDPPPRHAFAEIAARPLFSESRRPFVAESEADEEPVDENIPIELVGTLLTEEGWAALLQAHGEDARWFRAGDRIAGWQLEIIERDQVSLHLDGEAKLVKLRADLVQPTQPPESEGRRQIEGGAKPEDGDQVEGQAREIDQAEAGEEQAEPQTD